MPRSQHFVSKTIPMRVHIARFFEEQGRLGMEKALYLQQIHYMSTSQEELNNLKFFYDGHWWISISHADMRNTHLFCLSQRTVERIVSELTKSGYLIAQQIEASKMKQINWYRVNYDALDEAYLNWLSAYDWEKDYIAPLAEDYAMLTGKRDHLRHEISRRKSASLPDRPVDDLASSSSRSVHYSKKDLKKETLKDSNPTLAGQGGVETSLIDSWQPWLSKYQGGKKVWLKSKPAGLDDLHSQRWDHLFYAIAEYIRELPDFKNQPEAVRKAQAGQLHSMVGSVFSYLWLDAQHIERFVELYRHESDASLPSSLEKFPEHLAKYTVELEALDKPMPQAVPVEPETEPDVAPVDKTARKSLWDDLKKGTGK